MGVIGSIRKHSGWAVAIVGIAILAFIIGDLAKPSGKIPDVGKVDGETMTSQRFNELVAEMESSYMQRNQLTQVPSEVESQIREAVWQQFVEETLMGEQTSSLGLQVTTAEVNDMYTGTFIHPYVRQSFTDPQSGQFDVQQVNYWIENFDQIDTARRAQWIELEKAVKQDRQQQKYSTLLTAGFYMPKSIAAQVAEYGATEADVRVVALPYQSVDDGEVQLTDADYKAYYEKHRGEYSNLRMREELREVEYITFPVNPTPEDLAGIREKVDTVWAEFQATPDEEVPFFVTAESDRRYYDSSYVKASSFAAPFSESVEAAKEGEYIAPVQVEEQWMMGKVMKIAMRPDSMRASVVYVLNSRAGGNISRSKDQARAIADSVLTLLKGGRITMEEAVAQYSDDPQKENNGGDMEWQLDGSFGYINEQIFNTPVGSYFMEEMPQEIGYLVVKVTGKTAPSKKYRVALITREIAASNTTDRTRHSEASLFAGQNRTIESLRAAAQEQNLQVRSARLNMMANSIAGVSNARTLVQWVFNEDTKVGAVADQVYLCDGMYVVVALKDVLKKGYVTIEQAKPTLEWPLMIEKKGEMLMARAEEAMRATPDVASIAVALHSAVDTLDSIAYSDYYFGRFGMEPKVQATVAVSDQGLTGPVKGASGVYVLQIDSKYQRAVPMEVEDVRMQLEQGYRSKANMVSTALRDNAKIIDQRNKHF
ncbi:MAG: SurA N-terminal domain-containing protein [Bacteroidales bacterium]|nr:SurA N-terminal domain-containing protein [Bacteroidales bacterium]